MVLGKSLSVLCALMILDDQVHLMIILSPLFCTLFKTCTHKRQNCIGSIVPYAWPKHTFSGPHLVNSSPFCTFSHRNVIHHGRGPFLNSYPILSGLFLLPLFSSHAGPRQKPGVRVRDEQHKGQGEGSAFENVDNVHTHVKRGGGG